MFGRSRLAALRRRNRCGSRALLRLAAEAERLERSIEALENAPQAPLCAAAEGAGDALCRLEAALDAAAARIRRLSERVAPEGKTFTERRSDEDWRSLAGGSAGLAGAQNLRVEISVAGDEAGDWSEH